MGIFRTSIDFCQTLEHANDDGFPLIETLWGRGNRGTPLWALLRLQMEHVK